MTENTAPEGNVETVNPEGNVITENPEAKQEETKPKVPVESLSGLAKALLDQAVTKYAELKTVAETQAKTGDVGKLLSEAIDTSTDKEIVALRKKIESANEAIIRFTKEAEEKVKPTLKIPTETELAAMDTQYKTLAGELNAFATVFGNEVKKDHPDLTLFDYTGELPGKRRGAKAGQGAGTSRPRVKSVEYTHDKNGQEGWTKAVDKDGNSSFSHLVMAIKKETGESVSAADLHAPWLSQNGNKSDWTELPEVSTFAYSVTDKDQKTHDYMVRVTR